MVKVVRLDKKTPFSSVLVANRGEIALRIMQTAQEVGLRTIAVYTDADADAPHITYADKAVRIGDGPVGDSYLSIDKILEAAKESGAEAIHPGYGFLSERADFVAACNKAGLVFVGPSAESVELMGNKAAAKRAMIEAKVSCVPGYEGEDQSVETMTSEAAKIGFPVMIKAAAGGGGRGMRLVEDPELFEASLDAAKSEALNAFGSDEIILEKAIIRPRHVEVQIFADRDGNTIHLGERDCSVQRRHQKVIEESPCPVLSGKLRGQMCSAAVSAAKAIGYEGAGTVEFLLDQDNNFYFLEMNTRLQVEHPVTEMVTGLDLVEMQFDVAAGNKLGLRQDDVEFEGHAIEVRLYAEDPANGFLPSTGKIVRLALDHGYAIREDSGVHEDQVVSPFYDPLLAKLIASGETREEALSTMINALEDAKIFGVRTNRDFLLQALKRKSFQKGEATTAFIDEEFGNGSVEPASTTARHLAIAASVYLDEEADKATDKALLMADDLLGWSSSGKLASKLVFLERDTTHTVSVEVQSEGKCKVTVDKQAFHIHTDWSEIWVDGERVDLRGWEACDDQVFLNFPDRTLQFDRVRAAAAKVDVGGGTVSAPMHGNLVDLYVCEGDQVEVGERLAVLEAMKMRHELFSNVVGKVVSISATVGDQVKAGRVLIEIEEAS